MVIIKNVSKQQFIFTLVHDIYCIGAGKCECETKEVQTTVHDPKTGKRGIKVVEKKIPKAVYIRPGFTTKPINNVVRNLPDIQGGLNAKPKRIKLFDYEEPTVSTSEPKTSTRTVTNTQTKKPIKRRRKKK